MITNHVGIRSSLSILAVLPVGLALLFLPALARPAWGQPADAGVNTEKVDDAIKRGVDFLLRSQLPDGGWTDFRDYPSGVTALVTLALLNAGLSPEHPDVAEALDRLASKELSKTYTVALQTMAFCTANPNKYANMIRRNARWLIENQLSDGSWGYPAGLGDPSNSQFALLALHEAQRTGLNFPPRTWLTVFTKAKGYWQRIQLGNGSFPYGGNDSRGSMTCAGIASLVIAGTQVDSAEASADQALVCCGEAAAEKDDIQRALDWLGKNFSVTSNPAFPSRYYMYYMYALERVGRLTGQRYIGQHDWYREGAEQLIVRQVPGTGEFRGGGSLDGNSFTETAFALLFLSKGKRQTVISRLEYNGQLGNGWNQHSAAMQHLTAHTEQAWKRDLSWQNVDIDRSTVKELLETPVLFISGSRAPNFTDNQKRLLKEYVDQGGFIFAEACNGNGCDGREFEEYFQKLVVDLWGQPLERLPPEHPVWFAEARVLPDDLPPDAWLYGVQTCCRLGIVYSPYSLSCRWQVNLPYGAKPNYAEQVQSDLDTATKIGINVLTYATGKELKEKLDTVTILEEVANFAPTDRGVFFLPTLKHNAGYDDAPRAASNLLEWSFKSNPFQMSSEKRLVSITDKNLEQYAVVFMHGRGTLKLSEGQRRALRNYLERGGFLFADAICADQQFIESFRREMELVTGETLKPLPAAHSMFTDEFYGFDVRQVQIIDPDLSGDSVVSATRRRPPVIEGAKVKNRLAVAFSPLDMSCALESRHSLQCRGYVREDAARLGINIILYALQNF